MATTVPDPVLVERLTDALASSRKTVAFTGAGISTESGIPDFRGPQGVWTKVDPSEFTIQNYVSNPDHRRRVWRMRAEHRDRTYEPNAGHRALVELERLGALDCVITQNIDGLHQQAGSSVVLELHGNTREVKCLSCDRRAPFHTVIARLDAGEEDPRCLDCGGLLKSATVSFGEAMPEQIVNESLERAESADLCLVVGSSLVVFPAAGIPLAAARAGARVAIINNEPTELDEIADPVIRSPAGVTLSAVVARLRA